MKHLKRFNESDLTTFKRKTTKMNECWSEILSVEKNSRKFLNNFKDKPATILEKFSDKELSNMKKILQNIEENFSDFFDIIKK
jgi:hypothetical protein